MKIRCMYCWTECASEYIIKYDPHKPKLARKKDHIIGYVCATCEAKEMK